MTTGPAEISLAATGALIDFSAAGVLDVADVQLARRTGFLFDEDDPLVLLATALTVRALRAGSVCLVLSSAAESVADESNAAAAETLTWPSPDAFAAALVGSSMVAVGPQAGTGRPLRLVEDRLYLERYWSDQLVVAGRLRALAAAPVAAGDPQRLTDVLDEVFTQAPRDDLQRQAVALACGRKLAVIGGGPGTGKTTTVAKLLAVLTDVSDRQPRITLAAPTGKAAIRLEEAVRTEIASTLPSRFADLGDAITAGTVHRLLGLYPGSATASRPVTDDVLVVDELSMMSLSLMATLMEAVDARTRVVFVGDPDQLTSVEAGSVLADIVTAAEDTVHADRVPFVRLRHNWRFTGRLGEVAEAIRVGDADQVVDLITRGDDEAVELVTIGAPRPDSPELASVRRDVLTSGRTMIAAARQGDAAVALAALDAHRVLCGHRTGPFGVSVWARLVEQWLGASDDPWQVGRPILVTRNDNDLQLYNGDTGVVVATSDGARVAFAGPHGIRFISPALLDDVDTVHAMTIHKAQGSQFRRVSVVLPPVDSPLLTRELLYTAVTRASERVRILGSEEALRVAVMHRTHRDAGLSSLL